MQEQFGPDFCDSLDQQKLWWSVSLSGKMGVLNILSHVHNCKKIEIFWNCLLE